MKITGLHALNEIREIGLNKLLPDKPRIAVGMGTCGIGNGAQEIYKTFDELRTKLGIDIYLTTTGCFGFCAQEPLINIYLPGHPKIIFHKCTVDDAKPILENAARWEINPEKVLCKIEEWDHLTCKVTYGHGYPDIPLWYDIPFFKWQKKIVLRNCGLINPQDIDEYIAIGGYQSLYTVLKELQPNDVIEEVKKSKLRGRGGAGYPTGKKWEILQRQEADPKYIICNADEGDPGAYMNRNEIESDPHMLIEGMIIGAYAMGSSEGIVYIRAEYPLAVERLKKAIQEAQNYGLLGQNILGTRFDFNLKIVKGAGAFICGEETALIASLEGKTGRPRPRPPFPAQKGLWGKPTNINNVETWCNIPVIISKGGDWFAKTGTTNSTGTKVFSLVGKVKNTGLVELPLGTPLKTIIYNIGSASSGNKKVKAIQSGGPSGGCISAELFDTPVDYESLGALGAIMGSGGMVVMDEDNCMVDVARYFIEFTRSESCGNCVPCRMGLDEALRLLRAVTEGYATENDLKELDNLSRMIKDTSLCGLGQTAPNPVLTTLRYFRNEYEEHIKEKRCAAGVCEKLFLAPCENNCPLHMNIPGYIQLLKEGRMDEAFELIFMDNPLPASTGRVCQHPCEVRCRRSQVDQPVSIRELHRYITDIIFQENKDQTLSKTLNARKYPSTHKKIAIVGAGPSGLTAAFYLALLGHKITVYDAFKEAGGMLRYAIPEYRIPKSVLDREIQIIKDLGVTFVFNTRVGKDKSLSELENETDMILLTIGTWKEISSGIQDTDLQGVYHAIEFLEEISSQKKPAIGSKVIVIGGGNSAIDSARTARRLGAEVTVVYRREKNDMPAIQDEVEEAVKEGVDFKFLAVPIRLIGNTNHQVQSMEIAKTVIGDYDLHGRRKPVETKETFTLPCDTVILAIGESAESDFIKDFGVVINKNGTVGVDRFSFQTSHPKIFAGGDLVSGPSNMTLAMAAGKKAARVMDEKLMGDHRYEKLFKKIAYQNPLILEPDGTFRNIPEILPVENRLNNFEPVDQGLSNKQALAEAIRCLRCDIKESSIVEKNL